MIGPLKVFYDKDCTKEAQSIEFDGENIPILFDNDNPVGGEPVKQTFYLRFDSPQQNRLFVPDGKIEVLGDARLAESTMPRQVRAGGSFSITLEWVPPNPPMTAETLHPLSVRVRIPGRLIALARAE